MERLSPHKATKQFISTYVMGYDDTYEGEEEGRKKSILVKCLTTERFGSTKDIPKFMIGVNPTKNTGRLYLLMLRITNYTVTVLLDILLLTLTK
eukprot:10518752-Ditylum_brightwellii.AAC.1